MRDQSRDRQSFQLSWAQSKLGTLSQRTYSNSFRLQIYIVQYLMGRKKQLRKLTCFSWTCYLVTKISQKRMRAWMLNFPSCLRPQTKRLTRCQSSLINSLKKQLQEVKTCQVISSSCLGNSNLERLYDFLKYLQEYEFAKEHVLPFITILDFGCLDNLSSRLNYSIISLRQVFVCFREVFTFRGLSKIETIFLLLRLMVLWMFVYLSSFDSGFCTAMCFDTFTFWSMLNGFWLLRNGLTHMNSQLLFCNILFDFQLKRVKERFRYDLSANCCLVRV